MDDERDRYIDEEPTEDFITPPTLVLEGEEARMAMAPEPAVPAAPTPAPAASPVGLGGCLLMLLDSVDVLRKVIVNGLFFGGLFLFFLLLVALSLDVAPPVPDAAVLVVAPRGIVVEQLSGDPMARAYQSLTDTEVPETLLQDLLDAIAAAKEDERIRVLLLDLNQMLGANLVKLQALQQAIEDFKESGKKVVAFADVYSTARYYLASTADEVYLHEQGAVMIEGYGRYRLYYKEGLDRYLVDWNVFRVGTFKSAVEPYLRDGMSPEARKANAEWLGDLWNAYLADVSANRGMEVDGFEDTIARFNDHLETFGGDTGRMALELGLVDHLVQDDMLRQALIDEVGSEDEETHSFPKVAFQDYLLDADRPRQDAEDTVAVLVARGVIVDGSAPPGSIGGDSTATLIRQALHDEDTKALVLRVDSGGGSAFASEVIRRELQLLRDAGKPVVVSMGSYAASGGYWIATSSDEIWASPNTVTGSIGIFGMFPTVHRALAKYLGVRVDGVGTTWLSGVRPDRELPEEVRRALQMMVNEGYEDFLERVGNARDMERDQVDKIAQGRVWSGRRAHTLGLVDKLGTLEDAVAAAAGHAGLGEGEYRTRLLEKDLDLSEELAVALMGRARVLRASFRGMPDTPSTIADVFERLWRGQLAELRRFNDPKGVYAHCLCEID